MKRSEKEIAAARDAGNTRQAQVNAETAPTLFEGFDNTWPFKAQVPPARRGGTHAAQDGKFIQGAHTGHAGTRSYKLYIPGAYTGQALPLIVMLHGCSQDPDDFATGTRMNTIAEENHCFVLYPAQSESANGSRCWNWFDALNQRRNLGEPSIIAGMTRDIIRSCHIDTDKVFIAGLSSGGAMAAIMGATYPDLYAAVGIHSGMPYASARNWSSAMATMRNGGGSGKRVLALASRAALFGRKKILPVIVFHGDRDSTVHPNNGEQIIEQSIASAARQGRNYQNEPLPRITIDQGRVNNGRAYTQAVHRDNEGALIAEHWIVHGTGHAWSGGSNRGSFTDSKGPDAGKEMLRFFLDQAASGR